MSSSRVLNRREEHKRVTRAALEEAALALFARDGYEQTTVDEIAAEAGVSVRTFFRYFSGKRHVLFGDVAFERITRLRRLLAARPAGEDPLDSVRAVLEASDFTDPQELEQIRLRMRLMIDQPSLVP
ncbi:MAG TPA: TetR family transcriptional regulator, partial [Micromonosporaceae bacterium]|nr:TetR family transcriptional regulator [Micromonosporaceae bacterium]